MSLQGGEPDVQTDGQSQDGAEDDRVGDNAEQGRFLRDDGWNREEECEEDENGVDDDDWKRLSVAAMQARRKSADSLPVRGAFWRSISSAASFCIFMVRPLDWKTMAVASIRQPSSKKTASTAMNVAVTLLAIVLALD